MEQFDKCIFIYLKQNKQQLYLLLFALLLACIHFIGWPFLSTTTIYKYLIAGYTKFAGQLSVFIAGLLGRSVLFDPITYHLSFGARAKLLIMPVAAYRFYFATFLLLLIVPLKDYKYSILILTSSLILIALRAASITIIQLLYPQDMILLLWIDPLIYIPMFALILFVANKNPLIRELYNKINAKFSPLLLLSLPQLVLLLLLLTSLPRVILNYLNKDIIDRLVKITLEISQNLLSYFGYQTIVTSNFIFLEKFWLRLEQPCLGIGVVTIIWILISSVRSNWYNKLVFLTIFSGLFVIMNSVRLSVLLVFIQNTYSSGLNKVELHDNITYFMYLFAFISFLIYYFWFQDIRLKPILLKLKFKIL